MTEAGKSAASPSRTAILILGMHRSGTSAVAGVANALGAAGPRTLMAPDEFNPRGYFESGPLSVALEEMLASVGSYWHDWRELDLCSLSRDAADRHRTKIKALIDAEFSDEPLIVIKDPRICRFVPFMASLLDELNFTTVSILPVRNPLDVAFSLKRRDNLAPAKSVLLWLRHVLDAEHHSRHMRRAFVPYAELLTDWRKLMARVTEKTDIDWPRQGEATAAQIAHLLRPGLSYEKPGLDELTGMQSSLLREAYDVVSEIAASDETPDLLDRLDQVRMTFGKGCALYGTATADDELRIKNLRGQIGAQHRQMDALHGEVRWRHSEMDRLHEEVSRRFADIESLHKEVKQRDAEISQLHEEVSRRYADIDYLHTEVKQRDAEIRRLHDEVSRRDADITWLHDEVRRRDVDIQWLHGEVKNRDAEIKQLHDDTMQDDRTDADDVLTPAHGAKLARP